MSLRVAKKGNLGLGARPGDLIIQLKVRPHPYFKREGEDIYTDVVISLADVSFIFLLF